MCIFPVEWGKYAWKLEHLAHAVFCLSDFLHSSHLRRGSQTLKDQPSLVMPCYLQHTARSRSCGCLREVCQGHTDKCGCLALQLILFATIWHIKVRACCLWAWASISLRGYLCPTLNIILGEGRCNKKCKISPLTGPKPWHTSCGWWPYHLPRLPGHTYLSFPFPILAGIFPIHLPANGIWYRFSPSFVSLPLHNEVMWHYHGCLCVSLGPHQLAVRLHQYQEKEGHFPRDTSTSSRLLQYP